MHRTRRSYLAGATVALTGGLAGCGASSSEIDDGRSATDTPARETSDDETSDDETVTATSPPEPDLPTADVRPHVGHDLETLAENSVYGGVPKDGIPSIDDPIFAGADDVGLDPGDPVFGLVRNGVARAYRQDVLVQHEIVNDVVGGEPVAITYCPLTGTVQGFERGSVEFGVSGTLVNSNLIMYDRSTDSRWPQIAKTAVEGPLVGETLREFRLVWTTWDRWRTHHPDTDVLTEDTGYARRYGIDPYGGYNPPDGYYATDRIMFSPLERDDSVRPKRVVVGARTAEGSIAFDKERLLEARVLTGAIDDVDHVAVADPALQTAYVYENPDDRPIAATDEGYEVDGEVAAPDSLPLERVVAFDAMWFAWYGYYPDTSYVE